LFDAFVTVGVDVLVVVLVLPDAVVVFGVEVLVVVLVLPDAVVVVGVDVEVVFEVLVGVEVLVSVLPEAVVTVGVEVRVVVEDREESSVFDVVLDGVLLNDPDVVVSAQAADADIAAPNANTAADANSLRYM
jgi:hypothetical protein